ncbi:hypothetical protein RUM44_007494 [Polyplax serrata]|uniref:Protein shuttle craft n=1 Tax=Polyplax serrata TaxID=468196 RepID=A0ABR1B0W3_POLSC
MDNCDRFQSIVANSNLVATAGEFVPKSLMNLQQKIDPEKLQNNCGIFTSNQCSNLHFQSTSKHSEAIDGANKYSNLNSSIKPYVVPRQIASFELGESSSSGRNVSKPFFKKNTAYMQSKALKNYGNCQQKSHNKWKRTTIDESNNLCVKPMNGTNSHQQARSQQDNKKYLRINQNDKPKPAECEPSTKGSLLNDSVANQSGPKVQSHKYSENENLSWRYKEKYWKGQQQQPSKFKQNRCTKTGGNEGELLLMQKKSEPYKIHYQNMEKDSTIKNFNAANTSSKYRDTKARNVKKSDCEAALVTSQREQLVDLLFHGVLECLVCCESVSQTSAVWSCYNCYHVLHLKCVVKWARSSKSDFGWRCPACQNVTDVIPDSYYCFCGKIKDPEWNRQDCPHSCGEVCGKSFRKPCPHRCTLLCHPGPCPQCIATITKSCGCQKITKTVQCSSSEVVVCNEICGKELNCLIHTCSKMCHIGDCEECSQIVVQECYCQRNQQEVKCTIEVIGCDKYSCGNICEKNLSCGNHKCPVVCHKGECPGCQSMPGTIRFCPCGKTEVKSLLEHERNSCTDPIPTCESVCGKVLPCGTLEKTHTCKMKCHEGPCPDCTLETVVKCKCGHKDKKVPCEKLKSLCGEILCEKKCSKKRSCGKHKCNQICCTGDDHQCPLPCNRFLQCGLHRCEDKCHRGHCKPCLRASFDELSCECGAQVIFPPIPCGSRRPACDRPCSRIHSCDHPPVHTCHSESQCPPCTVLTKKFCHGRHELRKAVPCHQESFSCGLPCGKELVCGRHKCILPCHSGSCLKQDQCCSQPCTVLRPGCGHICGTPCHDGLCPVDVPCKEVVRVTCECGHRYTTRACYDNAKEFHRITTAKLATKMADLQAGQSIDLNVFTANKKLSYKTLECNDECKLIERNRRLAIALQIKNPDLSAKLTPRYSEYLKNWAKKDARFCQMIHDKLTDLVQLAKQSKQKSRSFSFDPMNREKRHFIHEYCDHFGCESVAYDQEPKRNVVATALKDKSWLPSMSVVEFIQKENSPRKVPAPITIKSIAGTSQRGMETLSSKLLLGAQQSDPSDASAGGTSTEPQLDYFDWRLQHT